MQAHLQRYQFIAENTLDLVCETTLDGFYTYLSPSYHDVLGYDPEDLIGRHFAELLHPDERQAVLAEFARRTEALSPGSATFRYRCKDGAWRWLETLGKPCPSPDNAIRAVFVSRDITDRKEAELSLRRMEDRLLLVVNHTPVILCATDAAGVITLFEGHGLESMGFGAAPAIGRPFSEVFSNQPEMLASFRRALAGETLVATVEANGRSLETYLTPALDDTNAVTGMSSVSLDVTESRAIRRALEEEQLKRAKLESLAVLAGGIAHNFNNLLTAILGNLSLAQMDAHPDSLIAEALGEAEAACLKTRDMVAELGTFARGGGPIKKLVRLQPCIRRAVLSATRGGRVQCDIRIDPALSHAEVDELQIAQVLQNLLRNACEATPENGTIGIDAHNAAPPDSLPPGSYVAIRVTDHGPGIAEANLQRIFDPYFTTKKGRLGLGLATAHSIIANHGGVLVAQSPAGAGAIFTIYLPASDRQAEAAPPGSLRSHDAGRILVMDDEEAIRALIDQGLSASGFQVKTVASGEDAVREYCAALHSSHSFDAVILDLTVLEGMSGFEAFHAMRAVDPGVQAIISSGYSDDDIMARHREHGIRAVVPKPYKMQELVRIVGEIVNSKVN